MTGSENTMTEAGATRDHPLYFQWVRDGDGSVNWGKVVLALGLTVLTAYLSVRTQRISSGPDFERTVRMAITQKRISAGVKLQRIGKAVEEDGWRVYEAIRSS